MPHDKSTTSSQENGSSEINTGWLSRANQQPGRLRLVLRLDKSKGEGFIEKEKESPTNSESRPKRTTPTKPAEPDFLADKKIPKKAHVVAASASEESPSDEHRPSRKRKSTHDSAYVFESLGTGKKNEESEGELSDKKHKKKSHRRENGHDDDTTSPPYTDRDAHSGFTLKLKLPKPLIPDTSPVEHKHKKSDGGSEGKKKKKSESDHDSKSSTPSGSSHGSSMKIKLKTKESPASEKKKDEPSKKAKTESSTPKKHTTPPPKQEKIVEETFKFEPYKPRVGPPIVVDEAYLVFKKQLSGLLGQLIKLDRQNYFADPVTEDIAPQYFTIIENPMDFTNMKKRLKENMYETALDLREDFKLMCQNCIRYNPPSTTYNKEAKRILMAGSRMFEKYVDPPPKTTEHNDKKKDDKNRPSSTPNKPGSKPSTPAGPHTPTTRSAAAAQAAAANPNAFGVAFPISSGQISSMQHQNSQSSAYPSTPPNLRNKPPPGGYPQPALNSPYRPALPGQANMTRGTAPGLPLQKSLSTNSMFNRPGMPGNATTPSGNVPRASGPVGKPGARPPVVSMGENQATQTQAMYSEQPKRKYVKLPVEEPPKPATPNNLAKAPFKLISKVGPTFLVTPANVPGSFVYSMYIPKFEPGTISAPKDTPTPVSPPLINSTATPASTSTSTTPVTTSASTNSISSPILSPSTTPIPAKSYINNYASVPSLYIAHPPVPAHDADDAWRKAPVPRATANLELMESIAHDCLVSMDTDSRTQMVDFLSGLVKDPTKLAFPKKATQRLLPRSQLYPKTPSKPAISVQSTPTPAATATSTPASLAGLNAEIVEQLNKLESQDITPQDLKLLQGLQIDLDILSSLTSSHDNFPSESIPMDITTTTTTTTTTANSAPQVDANRMVQEILDKNLENLWALQVMQHERISIIPTDVELKHASQINDALFVLGPVIAPSMLATRDAVKSAIEQSGLIGGKYRKVRV